jgi:hypothetical protein
VDQERHSLLDFRGNVGHEIHAVATSGGLWRVFSKGLEEAGTAARTSTNRVHRVRVDYTEHDTLATTEESLKAEPTWKPTDLTLVRRVLVPWAKQLELILLAERADEHTDVHISRCCIF